MANIFPKQKGRLKTNVMVIIHSQSENMAKQLEDVYFKHCDLCLNMLVVCDLQTYFSIWLNLN